MKCSRRSTTLRGRAAAAIAALWLGGASQAAAVPPLDEAAVRHAIVQAVRARMGDVDVEIDALRVSAVARAGATVTATPPPDARLGRDIRFVLTGAASSSARRMVGEATARVRVAATAVRTRRDIVRGATIGDDDIELVRDEPD